MFVMKNVESGHLMHWNPWKVHVPLKYNKQKRPVCISLFIIRLIVAFPEMLDAINASDCKTGLNATNAPLINVSVPFHLSCHYISAFKYQINVITRRISMVNLAYFNVSWVYMAGVEPTETPHGWNQLVFTVFFSYVLCFRLCYFRMPHNCLGSDSDNSHLPL